MIRYILVSIFVVISLPVSFAATEFEDSVPLELVKALLGTTPYGEARIFSDLSADFPSIAIPDDLVLMGSIDRGYGVAAVFSTELNASQTESTLEDAFMQAGYVQFELPGMDNPQRGFVSPLATMPLRNKRYCHDASGFLTINYSPGDRHGVVTLSSNFPSDSRSCADQLAEQQQAMSRRGGRQNGLSLYLPRMELPATDPRMVTPFRGLGGWSGSTNSIETDASLSIDWDIADVFTHFVEQIEAQDWAIDSRNTGTSSAIGIWTRSPEPGTDLIGTLTILKTGDESFELKFQLNSTGATNSPYSPFFVR